VTTGENEEDRSHTDPIEWSMYFKGFVTVLQCASEIVGQLLLEQFNNELSRECLFVSCRPEPSFADMACRVATCRRHVFGHVADSATLHVG
jgi:hypothetical protein